MVSPELVLMTLADARLPTGGHTLSAGLEPAVRAGLADRGRRLDEVAGFARDRLRTVTRVEAGTAVVARQLTLSGADPLSVVPAWAARTPSRAQRSTARRQGRGYLRLAGRVWPGVLTHLPADSETPRSVVLGVVAAVTGLDSRQTALLVGYDDAQTVIAASLKLLPVDPADAAGWLVALAPELDSLAAEVRDLTAPAEIPANGAPLLDALAERHTTERMRLFHA
jgi:urease accessory protein